MKKKGFKTPWFLTRVRRLGVNHISNNEQIPVTESLCFHGDCAELDLPYYERIMKGTSCFVGFLFIDQLLFVFFHI